MALEYCIFLSNNGSLVDKIIDWDETASWPHCGFMRLSDGWTYSAQLDGGVKWRPPDPKAKVLKLSVNGIDAALSKALVVEGEHYNYLGILGIAFAKNWSLPNHDFCSQLVFWAFQDNPFVNMKFIPLEHMKPHYILLGDVLEIE